MLTRKTNTVTRQQINKTRKHEMHETPEKEMTVYRNVLDQATAIFKRHFTSGLGEDRRQMRAEDLAMDWCQMENSHSYFIGVPSWPDREALILIIAAAKALCGVNHKVAVQRLEEALAAIQARTAGVVGRDTGAQK